MVLHDSPRRGFGSASAARAEICLEPQQQVPAGNGSTHVAAGDVDGDQDLDLVTVNPPGNTVLVLRNQGDGTFLPSVSYPVGIDPEGVACSDLNGDLDPDIAVTNEDTYNVSVLRKAGDGTFLPQATYPLGSTPREMVAADLDGEQDQDPVLNNGSGVFAWGGSFPVGRADGVAIDDPEAGGWMLRLFDAHGRLVASREVAAQPAAIQRLGWKGLVDSHELPAGVYFLDAVGYLAGHSPARVVVIR